MSTRSVSRSTIFPFPSSPHWAPTTTKAGTDLFSRGILGGATGRAQGESAGGGTRPEVPSDAGRVHAAAKPRGRLRRGSGDPSIPRKRGRSVGTAGIVLDGRHLGLDDLRAVARGGVFVSLSSEARARIDAAHAVVRRIVEGDEQVYGVNTGFGHLKDIRIPHDRLEALQINLIRSHAAGVGAPLDAGTTRALMLLRAHVLARGHSGVRPVVVTTLLDHLNADLLPVVPEQGSVGASGDLAPLSHLALLLVGE